LGLDKGDDYSAGIIGKGTRNMIVPYQLNPVLINQIDDPLAPVKGTLDSALGRVVTFCEST
jgi:hypothetical protein